MWKLKSLPSQSIWAAITQYQRLGGLGKAESYFSQFGRLGSPKSTSWKIQCLVRNYFFLGGHLLCVFTLWKRQKSFHWWIFFQVLFLNFWLYSATCRTSPTRAQTHAPAVDARSQNAGPTGKSTGGSYKITDFIHAGSTRITSSPPSDSPPNTITLGARSQHLNLRGHRHADHSTSTSPRLKFPWSWLLKW